MMGDIREYKRLLEEFPRLDSHLYGKDFLSTWELSFDEVQQVLFMAEALKWLYGNNISLKCFDPGLAILEDRESISPNQGPWAAVNRFSFVSAAAFLGLTVHRIGTGEGKVQAEDEIRRIYLPFSGDIEIIGIHDPLPANGENQEKNTSTGSRGNAYMRAAADAFTGWENTDAGNDTTLSRRPGLINLQGDLDYPLQAMADILVLKKRFYYLDRLRDKKIAVTWNYSPVCCTPLSVPQGIISLLTRFGMEVILVHPRGYDLNPQVLERAQQHSESSGGRFTVVHSPGQSLNDADIVYPINWPASAPGEQPAALQDRTFDEEKIKGTGNDRAILMETHLSAAWKPYVTASLILNTRFKKPVKLLAALKSRNNKHLLFNF